MNRKSDFLTPVPRIRELIFPTSLLSVHFMKLSHDACLPQKSPRDSAPMCGLTHPRVLFRSVAPGRAVTI